MRAHDATTVCCVLVPNASQVVGAFAQFLRRNDSLVALRSGSNVLGGYYNAGDLLLIDADPQV